MSVANSANGPIQFEAEGDTLRVIDTVEKQRFDLGASSPVEYRSVADAAFQFPVDQSIELTTRHLDLSEVVAVYIRSIAGDQLATVDWNDRQSLANGRYVLEICGPMKIYVGVEAPILAVANDSTMRISFDSATTITLGARSEHRHPIAELQTTSDPVDLMEVVSTFGSALKTLSPERSFPTLRGHPPAIRLADEVSIPSWLSPPDSGITLELPPRLDAVFMGAPLAYYLGATLTPGKSPRLIGDNGLRIPLDREQSLQTSIEHTLQQVFLLDCIVRTAGIYRIDLAERRSLEERTDLDVDTLYERSLEDRLRAYLEIPYPDVADLIPQWGLCAYVEPRPKSVEMLPYLVDDLALIRPQTGQGIEITTPPTPQFGSTRSLSDTAGTDTGMVLTPPDNVGLEQVWVGDGLMAEAAKAIPAGYAHRFDREPTVDPISITVVCNDDSMNREQTILHSIYSSETVDFGVYHDVDAERLDELLTTGVDFFHYIGHIDADGFACPDGRYDAATLRTSDVGAFFLNACKSFEQGRFLVEAGAIGGIVTLNQVINSGAMRIGAMVAELLDLGFPLYAALDIAREESLMGQRYAIIGDGRMTLSSPTTVPMVATIEPNEAGHRLEIASYPTSRVDMGSFASYFVCEENLHHLIASVAELPAVTTDELLKFLSLERFPVRIDGEHRWSTEVTPDDFAEI